MAYEIRKEPTAFALDRSDRTQRRIEDRQHLAFIRTLPSIISGGYGCEACHIRFGDPRYRKAKTPMGRKPDDAYTLPMLPEEHREQHSGNERAFYARYGIADPCGLALAIYDVTGEHEEAVKLILQARESR